VGPLEGIRIAAFEAIGPGPFAGMLLADMGADVLLIERPTRPADLGMKRERRHEIMFRGQRSVTLNLKDPRALEAALSIVTRADALIEGYRPGVMERLGLAPEVCLARNPRLVYGRMTGWGQSGPLAPRAGHDINYIALAGALNAFGRKGEAPVPPLNYAGDFGGGGIFLAFGIACALLQARVSGRGQVVDAAMVDGAAALGTMFYGLITAGQWNETRGENVLDGASHYYSVYQTKEGGYVSVGAIEARFYAELIERLGLKGEPLPEQNDRSQWPRMRERFAAIFRGRTRDEWCRVFEGADACFAPVLTFTEGRKHPQALARESFIEIGGIPQPRPAPRFTVTPSSLPTPPPERGQGGRQALADWGMDAAEIERLASLGLGFIHATD